MATAAAADTEAILRLIETETSAYFNKDYEGWARCWVHAPYVRRFGWYARGGRLIHQATKGERSQEARKGAAHGHAVEPKTAIRSAAAAANPTADRMRR